MFEGRGTCQFLGVPFSKGWKGMLPELDGGLEISLFGKRNGFVR